MKRRPGAAEEERPGRLRAAISTSTLGNSPAFGFSITITCSFGVLQHLRGAPTIAEIVMFGVAAALVLGLVEGAVTRGFRARPRRVPAEVRMLGTAQDFLSVGAGVLSVAGAAALVPGSTAWPLGGAVGTLVFLAAETAETLVAIAVQERRGDPEADEEET